jgi:hypothetical protein
MLLVEPYYALRQLFQRSRIPKKFKDLAEVKHLQTWCRAAHLPYRKHFSHTRGSASLR